MIYYLKYFQKAACIIFYELLLISFFYSVTFSQQSTIEFKNYTDADGLSSNYIACIIQDNNGFLWFGTEDGLNRYDGYTFKVYRKIIDDTASLGSNSITHIFENKDGNFWIRFMDKTVNLFNPSTGKTERFKDGLPFGIPNSNINQIYLDSLQQLWIIKSLGEVYRISEKNSNQEGKYTIVFSIDSFINSNFNNVIPTSSYPDRSGNLWLKDWSINLYYIPLNNTKGRLGHILEFDVGKLNSQKESIYQNGYIIQDSKMNYWMGSNKELIVYNELKGVIRRWSIPSGTRSRICFQKDHVCVPSNDGLYCINLADSVLQHYPYEPSRSNGIAFNMVNCVFTDKQGILWAGTSNGLSKYDPVAKKIQCFRKELNSNTGLKDNRIRSILSDDNGKVWIGTDQFGLCLYNRNSGLYEEIKTKTKLPDDINGKNHGIGQLLIDKSTLWIGTRTGLYAYDNETGMVHHFVHDTISDNTIPNNGISCLASADSMYLWIGTGNGISRYDKIKKTFTNFSYSESEDSDIVKTMNVRSILPDNNILWIGLRGEGLLKMTLETANNNYHFKHYFVNNSKQLNFGPNFINSIYKDKNGILWLATYSGGLIKFDPETEKYSEYTTADGLPNDIVYGILEDSHSNLWMSTNNGIAEFNPLTNKFKSYDITDGVQGNEFNSGAYYEDKNGYMYFGGTNGWNMFHPDSIHYNEYLPDVVFTNLQVLNKDVVAGENSILKNNINYTDEIILQPYENIFSIEFAALNFTNTIKNQYKYLLEGYDTSWQNIGTRRFVTFTNLDPGDYVLNVMGSNNDGKWSRKIKKLSITILPDYYQTLWFKILMALLFVTIVLGIRKAVVRFKEIRIEEQHKAETRIKSIKEEEERKAMHEIKMDLHDNLKNDISSILFTAEDITPEDSLSENANTNTSVNRIIDLAQTAISTANDLSWAFDPAENYLTKLSFRMKNYIVATIPKIKYKLDPPAKDVEMILPFAVRKHFYLIFKECIHNLAKHSKCSNAFIKWDVKNELLTLEIYDDGNGFDVIRPARENGLKHIKNRAAKINAELKIESAIGKGTKITLKVILPE